VLAAQVDRGGLSVLRHDATDAEFVSTFEALKTRAKASGNERYLHGVISFQAKQVRYDERKRFMCVYDTALSDRPQHADVMAPPLPEGCSKNTYKARTKRVIELVGSGFESAAAFRGGLLAAYARPAT
jgi:hypothetical protein